jgi:hypothetical protein
MKNTVFWDVRVVLTTATRRNIPEDAILQHAYMLPDVSPSRVDISRIRCNWEVLGGAHAFTGCSTCCGQVSENESFQGCRMIRREKRGIGTNTIVTALMKTLLMVTTFLLS